MDLHFATPGLDRRFGGPMRGKLLDEIGTINLAALQRSARDTAAASPSLRYLPCGRSRTIARVCAALQKISTTAPPQTVGDRRSSNLIAVDTGQRGEGIDA